MSDYDLVVIGGGISGLGFAHFANQRGLKTLVLEASDQAGGCIRSHHFDTPAGSFWAELGAHTCYNSYGNLLQILQETGQLDSLRAKQKLRYQLYTREGLKSIPSELNVWELLGVIPRLLMAKKPGHTASEYFGGIIGRRNFQRVLGPALDAVVCQPARDFPADSLFRKKPRRKEIMRSYTGPAGLQSFVDGIVAQPGLEVRANSPVEGLQATDTGYQISIAGGDRVEASHLALAVPPDIVSQLLQPLMPRLAETVGRIEMVEIESLAVLLSAKALQVPPLAGIIGRDEDFYSVVSRDLVPDPDYRAFTFHFRPGRLDEDVKLQRIQQVLGVDPVAIEASAGYANRLPALRLGNAERVAELDLALRGQPLALTGNWFDGVSIEDSLIRSAAEFDRLFPE
ncbi:MAG: FAD-dependent oxidoreductase [Chromatiales bacterium]|jgi:predicted NAD/FAD-dependent oxidoreductase